MQVCMAPCLTTSVVQNPGQAAQVAFWKEKHATVSLLCCVKIQVTLHRGRLLMFQQCSLYTSSSGEYFRSLTETEQQVQLVL